MTRVNFALLMAVIASAMVLVNVQYESRRLFTELDRARAEAHRLESEQGRLQAERRAQATPARVERLAREKLQMRQVSPAITNYVNYSVPPATTAVSSPAAGAADTGLSLPRTQGAKP